MQRTYWIKEHVPTGGREFKDARNMFPLNAENLRMQGTCFPMDADNLRTQATCSHWMQRIVFPLEAENLRIPGTCSHWMQRTYWIKEHVPTGCRQLKDARNIFQLDAKERVPTGFSEVKDAKNMFPLDADNLRMQGTCSHCMQGTSDARNIFLVGNILDARNMVSPYARNILDARNMVSPYARNILAFYGNTGPREHVPMLTLEPGTMFLQ